ncbi:hypothetical protein OH77DRAFT_987529 [Trametes cingulata]|nr:hypothetical protein OH77DRAFT_987529 [Trametes cingulata]
MYSRGRAPPFDAEVQGRDQHASQCTRELITFIASPASRETRHRYRSRERCPISRLQANRSRLARLDHPVLALKVSWHWASASYSENSAAGRRARRSAGVAAAEPAAWSTSASAGHSRRPKRRALEETLPSDSRSGGLPDWYGAHGRVESCRLPEARVWRLPPTLKHDQCAACRTVLLGVTTPTRGWPRPYRAGRRRERTHRMLGCSPGMAGLALPAFVSCALPTVYLSAVVLPVLRIAPKL